MYDFRAPRLKQGEKATCAECGKPIKVHHKYLVLYWENTSNPDHPDEHYCVKCGAQFLKEEIQGLQCFRRELQGRNYND